MQIKVPLTELNSRLERFRKRMDDSCPDWQIAIVFSKINLYYFTGTMQEGVLFIPKSDEAVLWVRRSYERAVDESLFPSIKPMESYRDAAVTMKNLPEIVYLEKEIVPIAILQRFQKYFPFSVIESADLQIGAVRSVKSRYELALMEQSGKIHERVTEKLVPAMLHEGMSELEFFCDLYTAMMNEGHHGVARFGMFDTETILGQIAFGESSIYPTCFNGPGGNYGMSPAVPIMGSRNRKLRKGDLVFVDTGCGVEGYHTDKTMTYMFGKSLPDYAIKIHLQCVDVQNNIAAMLKPGAIPSVIYNDILKELSPDFLENFMGFGTRKVKFLGHGIGLTIDELPVIANGFDEPIREGMVFAIEPKKGIPHIGMVGIENTFIVTPQGGRNITGNHPGLLEVW
ncbi:MAG: Xaa-Pro peptidase family protein [Bacteroidia bacterium]|nr:Xaa-Pro peptidase family protein [Bacteroidia bacterium]